MIDAAVMPTPTEPSWLSAYASGEKFGWAQAVMAYADYYCVDGSADDDPEIAERLVMRRPPMVGYASRTGNPKESVGQRRELKRRSIAIPCPVLPGVAWDVNRCGSKGCPANSLRSKPKPEECVLRAQRSGIERLAMSQLICRHARSSAENTMGTKSCPSNDAARSSLG